MNKEGIFCIEGEWDKDLKDRGSVQLLIEFLSASNDMLPPIYRRSATIQEFNYFVEKWKDCQAYSIGYFCFHGEKGKVCLANSNLTLLKLGDLLAGACENKHIILSTCKTL